MGPKNISREEDDGRPAALGREGPALPMKQDERPSSMFLNSGGRGGGIDVRRIGLCRTGKERVLVGLGRHSL